MPYNCSADQSLARQAACMKLCREYCDPKWEAPHVLRYAATLRHIEAQALLTDCFGAREWSKLSVLDIGGSCCGPEHRGAFARAFAETYNVESLDGTDCDLRGNYCDEGHGFAVIGDDEFDLILCLEVFEHIGDPNSVSLSDLAEFTATGQLNLLKSMQYALAARHVYGDRKLIPNAQQCARIILTTPNSIGWTALQRIMHGKPARMYDPHVREVAPDEFRYLAVKAGLTVHSTHGLGNVWPQIAGGNEVKNAKLAARLGGFFNPSVLRDDDILYVLS